MRKPWIIALLLLALSTAAVAAFILYQRENQPCNTMVTLAPGKTLQDVCDYWATQSAEYKQANRYCGCGPYK